MFSGNNNLTYSNRNLLPIFWVTQEINYVIIKLKIKMKISKCSQPKEVFLTDGNEASFES